MPIHRFGPFQYDAEQRLLLRDGEIVPLVPKAIDTLHVLLERRGRVVEKSELMKLVWPDTTVEDVGLARNISILRKALGDEGGESEYIETIPRRGYRFAVEPQAPARMPAPTRRNWVLPAAAIAALAALGWLIYWQFYTPSRYLARGLGFAGLAVVPFECLTPELESSAFARGVSESLVSDLANLPGLQVVSPSTVRRHQRFGTSMGLMGRLLGLDALVEGTVRKSADRVRITARLVDVHTGKLIWANNYDYAAADLGDVEDQAAHEIAVRVAAHLAIHNAATIPK
jgi:DNA-binding winged helix-turn-helix (wHTH) protein/TolB-like protein